METGLSGGTEQPVALCDVCRGEVYGDELVHCIDGYIVCPDCFDDFVTEYFEANMVLGKELIEAHEDD